MASIFTGLAFMHGHIVDRELVLRLGRDEPAADRGAGAAQAVPARTKADRKASREIPARPACATC
ncbi:MAG: hypothetical protein ABWX83_06195 [Luteibacter sp.]